MKRGKRRERGGRGGRGEEYDRMRREEESGR